MSEDSANNLIPTILEEVQSGGENESEKLLSYYERCNTKERAVIDNVMMYLCGWTFETLLKKSGINR